MRNKRNKDEPSAAVTKNTLGVGGLGWILLWILGVPVPVLVLLFLARSRAT